MGFYIDFWKNGLNFSGRTRRLHFIILYVIHPVIFGLVFGLFTFLAFTILRIGLLEEQVKNFIDGSAFLFGVLASIPLLAMMVRRLHDGGFSGWWLLLWFAPIIPVIGLLGLLALFIMLLFLAQKGPNDYGEDPRNVYKPRVHKHRLSPPRKKNVAKTGAPVRRRKKKEENFNYISNI